MVEAIMSEIANCAHLVENAEVNLEANPTSTELETLRCICAHCLQQNSVVWVLTWIIFHLGGCCIRVSAYYECVLLYTCCRDFKAAGVTRLSLGVQVSRSIGVFTWWVFKLFPLLPVVSEWSGFKVPQQRPHCWGSKEVTFRHSCTRLVGICALVHCCLSIYATYFGIHALTW